MHVNVLVCAQKEVIQFVQGKMKNVAFFYTNEFPYCNVDRLVEWTCTYRQQYILHYMRYGIRKKNQNFTHCMFNVFLAVLNWVNAIAWAGQQLKLQQHFNERRH